ncbi:MAG: transposase [Oscillospiraceae bacterium]
MENWKKDSRKDIVMVDVDALVPPDHLLRKVERVMDYDWLYERLSPYYCADNGRPGTDPVVLIKMVLIQHLFGIASLRQTHREIQVNIAYRWFLGYSLLDEIPHFATVSYAFCKRFPPELSEEIFAHILNKALNNRMVDPSMIFIDGTHIKASANKRSCRRNRSPKPRRCTRNNFAKRYPRNENNWVRKSTMTMMTKIKEVPEEERLRKRCPKPTRTAECL